MKQQGFSLIEVLITLTISCMILMLIMHSLNHIARATMQIQQKIIAQDNALTALLLLKQQALAANLNECGNARARIQNLINTSEFNTFSAYQILKENSPVLAGWHLDRPGSGQIAGKTVLFIHRPIQRFYINAQPETNSLTPPAGFKADSGDFVVVDDCHKILFTKVNNFSYRRLAINGFHAHDYAYPLSVSIIQNRLYYLGKINNGGKGVEYALYRSNEHKQREEIIPDLADVEFDQQDQHLNIKVQPKGSHAVYHASV